jgi:hypothetical protein
MKRDGSRSHILDLATSLSYEEPETLSSWILTQQHHRAPDAHGKLTQLLTAIAVSCKFIATAVRKVRPMRRRTVRPNVKVLSGARRSQLRYGTAASLQPAASYSCL